MANLQGLPPRLQQVQRRILADIDELSAQMDAGQIDVNQWRAEMQRIIDRGMSSALMAGKNSRQLTDLERQLVRQLTAVQGAFLDNFANDILTKGWLPAYMSRAQMYGSSTTAAYAQGEVIRQAGQWLPLPAMPTEGTQCLSNCGCRWRVEVMDAARGDFDGYWLLGKDDNCQTCLQRAADWSPVRIRGNVLQI